MDAGIRNTKFVSNGIFWQIGRAGGLGLCVAWGGTSDDKDLSKTIDDPKGYLQSLYDDSSTSQCDQGQTNKIGI